MATQKEICFNKLHFFEEAGVDRAIRFEPDKGKYKCPICHHWHLTTVDQGMNRGQLHTIKPKISLDIDDKVHCIIEAPNKNLYYLVHKLVGFQSKKGKLKHLELFDKKTKLNKKFKMYIKERGITIPSVVKIETTEKR